MKCNSSWQWKCLAACLSNFQRGSGEVEKWEEGVFFKWTASRCQIAALEAIKTPFKSLAVHRERDCNQVVGIAKWVRQIKLNWRGGVRHATTSAPPLLPPPLLLFFYIFLFYFCSVFTWHEHESIWLSKRSFSIEVYFGSPLPHPLLPPSCHFYYVFFHTRLFFTNCRHLLRGSRVLTTSVSPPPAYTLWRLKCMERTCLVGFARAHFTFTFTFTFRSFLIYVLQLTRNFSPVSLMNWQFTLCERRFKADKADFKQSSIMRADKPHTHTQSVTHTHSHIFTYIHTHSPAHTLTLLAYKNLITLWSKPKASDKASQVESSSWLAPSHLIKTTIINAIWAEIQLNAPSYGALESCKLWRVSSDATRRHSRNLLQIKH